MSIVNTFISMKEKGLHTSGRDNFPVTQRRTTVPEEIFKFSFKLAKNALAADRRLACLAECRFQHRLQLGAPSCARQNTDRNVFSPVEEWYTRYRFLLWGKGAAIRGRLGTRDR